MQTKRAEMAQLEKGRRWFVIGETFHPLNERNKWRVIHVYIYLTFPCVQDDNFWLSKLVPSIIKK